MRTSLIHRIDAATIRKCLNLAGRGNPSPFQKGHSTPYLW